MAEIIHDPIKAFASKIREIVISVLPITVIVLLLHFTAAPLEGAVLGRFFIGAILIVLGLTTFLVGIDLGVTPLGSLSGNFVARNKKLWLVVLIGLVLGFLISIAEPGLIVLSHQVRDVSGGAISDMSILVIVSLGMAVMLVLAFMRIAFSWPLKIVLTILYLIIGIMAMFATSDFLAISFDASGATTGVLAVPFMLALAIGVSRLKRKGEPTESDNFGLVAITSTGAIVAVLLMQNFVHMGEPAATVELVDDHVGGFFYPFIESVGSVLRDTLVAVGPLLLICVILQVAVFRLSKWDFLEMVKGFALTFVGLVVFLLGVYGGFMEVGAILGQSISGLHDGLIVGIGYVLGVVTILAEPAVYVLTHEIEEITHGTVKRIPVLLTLAIGVGCAIGFAMLRIVTPDFSLWHILLPGYLVAVALSFLVPDLFVGMAWDAGGVATGPITATFILAFTQGVANYTPQANVLIDGFGMIALVAMMPIITLQVLGLIFRFRHPEAQRTSLRAALRALKH